ncbi:MAG: hypothetical protein IPH13_20750 [Planctomycetes bacterium]|nr:hypothetical protein [Planctomycetota bacterium]
MTGEDELDDTGEEPTPGSPQLSAKTRQSFTKVPRTLADKDLASPAVNKMLLDDIDRLERENIDLSDYLCRYHDADKRAAVLQSQLTFSKSSEILFAVCLTIGAALIGYAPSVWDTPHAGWMTLVSGAALIIASAIVRVVYR